MTRDEKMRRVQAKDGKVFEISGIEIHHTFLDPQYAINNQSSATLGSTGRLDVFELRPMVAGMARFVGRWDGGSRQPGKVQRDDLDIDVESVSGRLARRFNRGDDGYSGHHTTKCPNSKSGRCYEVSIRWEGRTIFEGSVSFLVHRKIELPTSAHTIAQTVLKID